MAMNTELLFHQPFDMLPLHARLLQATVCRLNSVFFCECGPNSTTHTIFFSFLSFCLLSLNAEPMCVCVGAFFVSHFYVDVFSVVKFTDQKRLNSIGYLVDFVLFSLCSSTQKNSMYKTNDVYVQVVVVAVFVVVHCRIEMVKMKYTVPRTQHHLTIGRKIEEEMVEYSIANKTHQTEAINASE